MIPHRRRLFTLLCFVGAMISCRSVHENRNPIGETFPSVEATTLAGAPLRLPQDLAGKPVVLLIGYVMETQFDLDRWLVGLMQLETPVARYEVPTLPGLVPGLIAGTIDDGMRAGIPSEDWASVATVYDEADEIVAFTGDQRPRNGRIMLLDERGVVRWFHDRGFSAGHLAELDRAVRALAASDADASTLRLP